jgi:hypothetical protein
LDRIADKIRLKVERKRSNVEERIKGFLVNIKTIKFILTIFNPLESN